MNKAIILDRDGTILKDRNYLADPDGIYIYKGVIPALKKLRAAGWKLIIGTNQAGIARGYLTEKTLHAIHRRLLGTFRKEKLMIDDIYYCPHHPNDCCECRKPNTAMLERARKKHHLDLSQCIVIGDNASDIQWGKNVGARTILVLTGYGKRMRAANKVQPDHVSRSLPHAANWILSHE